MLWKNPPLSRKEFCEKYRLAINLNRWMRSIEDKLKERDMDTWNNLYNKLINDSSKIEKDIYKKRGQTSVPKEGATVDESFLNKVYTKFEHYIKGKKIGQHSILDTKDIPIEKVIKAFKMYKTVRKTAKALGLTHPTVSKILKDCGIEIPKVGGSILKGTQLKTIRHRGIFAKYIKAHPGTVFPRSAQKIADMIGCSRDAIERYLTQRKKAMLAKIKKLPDLRLTNVILKKRHGHMEAVRGSEIASYYYSVDRFSLCLSLCVKTINGETLRFVNVPYEALLQVKPILAQDQ